MKLGSIWQLSLDKTNSVSVRTKVMGIVLGTILLLSAGMTWEVRKDMIDTLSRQLEKRGISIARDVSARATDLILTNNSYALYELLRDTVENNEDVRYVMVLDQNGNVLVHTFGQAVPKDLISANTAAPQERYRLEILDTEEGLIRDIAVPVFEGRAGVARVGMSDVGMKSLVTSATERLLAATALASLLGIIAAFLLTSILTRPVRELVEATTAVARGDLARKARVWAKDEIGQLGEAFNSMTTALVTSKQEIDEFNKQLVRRNEELSALNAVATAISQSRNLGEVLPAGLAKVLEVMHLRAGWVFLLDNNGQPCLAAHAGLSSAFIDEETINDLTDCVCANVLRTGEIAILDNLPDCCPRLKEATRRDEGLACHVSVPLTSKGKVVGVMNVASGAARPFRAEELDLLRTIGNQIGVAVENSQLWAELSEKEELRSQLLVKVMSAQEEERKRIARELHDETSQSLTSLIVGLKVLERCDPADVADVAAELRAQASKTLDAVHDLALELRPSALDDLGLVAALERHVREYARRHNCEVDFQATGIEGVRLPSQTELAIYRIVQEALTNTAKYAEASAVSVTLERRGSMVVAIVEDDGRGFDVKGLLESRSTERKLGLFGMQERAALIGGRLTVESTPGAGTTVFVEAPLELERSIA